MVRNAMNLEHKLIACANADGAEIRISTEEIQIRTSDMLSTETLRAALAIEAECSPGGCSLTHRARYMVLKVRRGPTNPQESGNYPGSNF